MAQVRHARSRKPSFQWSIRSTDISFMRTMDALSSAEGCGCGGDCSAAAQFDKLKPAPVKRGKRR